MYKIALLPGDGIGTEIISETVKVLKAIETKYDFNFEFLEGIVGGASIDAYGRPLTKEVLDLCKDSDAILFGAVGGPKWDELPKELRPEQAILGLRKSLGLYANLRPIFIFNAMIDASPIKREIIQDNLDILIVRELTGGLYFGKPKGIEKTKEKVRAFDTMEYTYEEIERVARHAFEAAKARKGRLTSVDKANVLETSRLWRTVVKDVAKDYPEVTVNHLYVDNCSMQLIINPAQFDVILTENTFGDILSDEASVLTGSIGMLPSASLGSSKPYLYEPIHGSAPDVAGKGKANPIACILSAAMMLEYSFGEKEAAKDITLAVEKALDAGYRTADIKGDSKTVISTKEMGDIISSNIG
ncbi:MAG: 3-isopropylmalate dehydrogenase [Tepidanaerobacteraceae bacterium]